MTTRLEQAVAQFSVYDPDYAERQYEIYSELRTKEPVFWHQETQSWFITRYEDVTKLLVGDKFITTPLITNKMKNVPAGEEEHFADIVDIISTWMIYNDRPVHTRLRKHMNRAFWTAEVELIRPEIKKIVSDNLDRILLEQGQSFDFVKEIAHPIPALILCKMLGIPGEEVERFIKWSDDIAAFMQDFVVSPAPDREISGHTRNSMNEMHEFLFDAIRERRAKPRNDLLSRLISEGPDDDQALADIEVVRQTIHLIFGGHKIPQFLLSNCLHQFFTHPEAYDQIVTDPSRMPEAVEECIRVEGPIQYITRHAAKDIELGGKLIRDNDSVYFFLGTAGRDEAVFEDAGSFKLGRQGVKKALAFGGGYHACIAAAFARMEVEEVMSEIVRRIPNMKPLYHLDRPQWTQNPTFHGIVTMPVELID